MEQRSHFKLEHRKEKPLSRPDFIKRMGAYVAAVAALIVVVLLVAMSGYHSFEGMSWIDAFLNAAMILGGMGPAADLHTALGHHAHRHTGARLRASA